MPRFLFCFLLLTKLAFAQSGSGLTGQYYDNNNFTTLKTTRTDALINFNFGTGIPSGTAITDADTFSIAWSGQIEPEFTALYTFYVTADDGARLWVNDQMVVCRTYAAAGPEMRGQVQLQAGQRANIRLEYIEQTGSASVKLEWSCGSRARELVPTARLYPSRVDKIGGSLMKEHWSGIAGGTMASLTSNANYPNKPSGREFITSFECLAQDWADSYGTRVTGYIVPPVTGSYTFAVSGDEVVELYLSTDSTSANKSLIASVASATAFRAWGTPSPTRTLVQGQRYYVEMLHKENTGTDHWSVGWKKPGDSVFSVIPGSALAQPGTTTAQPTEANLLNTLAQEHPRMFATAERFAKLKATYLSATASQAKTWATNAITSANTILTQAPVAYSQDVRGTILDQSRTVKDRMYKLGVAWQMTGDPQYAERAWTELNTVADNTLFPDWHPAHFLDTAEMTHACAVGYDWFYQYWTQARRDTIRTAIINKGLNAGLSQYTSNVGWSQSTGNNWNMVCNGGLIMGALAVGTESEALTENIINRGLNSTRPVWKHFTTDNGNWYEGPGYWGYTTEYGIRMFAALEWVLGSDFGISSTTDLSESGFTQILALGTSNVIFNYADAGAGGGGRGPVFQWMARRYGQPVFDWWNNQGSGGALDALWWNDSTSTLTSTGQQPDMAFHGDATTAFNPQEMVTMRGKWSDSRATFIGCKGGQMGADHGDLDAGTFVLDALGKRWFHDLGSDDYALPNYFTFTSSSTSIDRWDYYRMRTEGQNTLVFNPSANADMVLNAVAPLIAYQSETGGTSSFAIHDLTPVYSGMSKIWRGTRLMGARNQVLIQDEIQASTGKTMWWFAHYTYPTTTVTIDPDGTSALMTQGAERMWVKIVNGGGTFQIMDAVPLPTSPNPAGQNANAGYKKLAINLTNVTNTTLAVWFVPLSTGEPIPTTLPTITALNSWNLSATNDAPVAINGVATSNGENAVDIELRNYVTDDTTPVEQMRFTVGGAVNGTITLNVDGHTAHFVPTPGYTGVPSFTFTVTDTGSDPRMILAYDFDTPDSSASNTVTDVSGNGRDGTIETIGAGTATLLPSTLPGGQHQGNRVLDLSETGGANAARLSRILSTTEINWNTSDWTIVGWFNRRSTANEDFIWHLNTGDGFGTGEELYAMANGASNFTLHHYPGPDVNLVNAGPGAPGSWHHFAIVRQGTQMLMFVDGNFVQMDADFALNINQAYPLIFGGHTDTTATYAPRWFNGQLDELAVFNAALSYSPENNEIGALANGKTVRHFGGKTATGTISLSAAAVNYVWTSTANGNWTTGTNWQSGSTPNSTRGASVQFFTGQTLAGGTVASSNDFGGTFQMNNLTLAGTSSAATTATISGGNFQLLNNGTLMPTVNLTGTSGSTTNSLTYNINTPITLGADTTFNATNNGKFIFNGDLSGAGGLTRMSSSSTLILAGTNTYTGDTTISAGTLQIGNDGATGSLGTGDVINNGQLRFDRTGALEVPNAIGGTGSLYVDCPINAGTITLSGTNTFDGGVTVNSGTLRITNSTALGDGTKTIILSNGTAGAPQLRLDGSSNPIELAASLSFLTSNDSNGAIVNEAGNNIIGGLITLTGGGGSTRIYSNAGTLTLSGAVTANTTGRTLKLMGVGSGLMTGDISNGNATNVLALSKEEAGTWMLSGNNSFSGTTSLLAGTLVLGSPNALGNGGFTFGNSNGGTSITAGATLDLNGQQSINEVITVRGTGVSNVGGMINNSATPASIASGVVSAIATTAGGVHSAVPDVSITGGGGTGATATATLGLSAASFTLAGGTTVYSAAPTVTISGGGGYGATATAVLTSGVVTSITITNAGTGYTTAPTIAFSGGTVTTAGTNPSGTGNATNFMVAAIQVTNPGSGYTSAPNVNFSSGTGTTANANLSGVSMGATGSIGGTGDIVIYPGITGSSAMTKVGSGTLTLNGTYTNSGATTVSAGTLQLNGSQNSAVTVNTGATFIHPGSITGNVTIATGGLDAPSTSPSLRNITGSYSLNSGGTLRVLISGSTAGTQYDQVVVSGTVTFGGTLDVVTGPNLTPGSTFRILDKAGTTTTTTTFTSKAENSTFVNASGYTFRINYNAGTGNDIVLTLIASPIEQWRFTNFGSMLNNGTGLDTADTDSDGVSNLIEYATKMNPALNDVVPQSATKNGSTLDYVYTKNKAATDLTYVVEWSDTLLNDWSTVGVSAPTILNDNGVTQQIKVTVPSGSGVLRRFVRLKVTRP